MTEDTARAVKRHKPDVLTIALFVAAAIHAIVLLGVSFRPFLDDMRTPPALEVILVEKSDMEAPDEAAYLAQSSQDGGGETDENTRPATPFASALDVDSDGLAPTPILKSSPEPTSQTADDVVTAVFAEETVETEETTEENEQTDAPDGTIVVEQNMDIARLAAEIDRQQQEFAKRPKKKHINARTKETASAEYMYRWVEQVERVGNLNYPDDARRARLTGALILIVGIYKNGEIESITVDESSGHKLLDDAAVRIVEQAAPFEPMTGTLAEETDILYIVRTWEFQSSNSVISY
ncbi:MAG: TonB family protein [Granulosicoccus sp.]|nr:TonB family protein [Granulosicoccus sp.]